MRFSARSLMVWLGTTSCVPAIMLGAAYAQPDRQVSFNITASNLSGALNQLAQQSDRQIVFKTDIAAGKPAKTIHGTYAPDEALNMLLRGSGLMYRVGQDDTYVITASSGEKSAGAPRSAEGSPLNPIRTAAAETNDTAASRSGATLAQGPANQSGGLETVTVTASRVETNEQKTPMSMTVITAADLNVGGTQNANFLQQNVPNIQIVDNGDGAAMIAVRGVVSTNNSEAGDPAVAVNFDGVYQGRPQQVGGAFLDVQRVEVLLGPQGTLYGRNATSGVINITSNKPILNDFHASAALDLGNYAALTGQFVANIPVTDTIAIRMAFMANTHEAYYNSSPPDPFFATDRGTPGSWLNYSRPDCHVSCLNSTAGTIPGSSMQDNYNGRLHVLWQPSDDLSVLFTGNYSLIRGTTSPGGNVVVPICTWFCDVHSAPLYALSAEDNLDYNIGLHVDYKTAIGTLSYIGSYDNYQAQNTNSNLQGFPPTNGPFFLYSMQHVGQVSQELRLAGDVGPLTYQGGIYYFTEQQEKVCACSALGFNFDPVLDTSHAIYGQVTYSILDSLRLTAGGRYNWDYKSRVGASTSKTTAIDPKTGLPYTLPELQCSFDADIYCTQQGVQTVSSPGVAHQGWEKATYHLGVDYDLTESIMLYGSLSTGFKQGGYFDGVPTQPGGNSYGPENVQSWEVGAKSRFFDNTLQVNASLFRYLYTGFQVTYLCNDKISCGPLYFVTQTFNAQKASPQGAELQTIWAPTANDKITFDAAYLDAHYDTFVFPHNSTDSTTGRSNFNGGQMIMSPPWEFNIGLQHVFDFSDGSSLTAYVHTHYQSTEQLDFHQFNSTKQKGWEQSDLNLTYSEPNNRWDVKFYVRNLENNWHLTGASPVGAMDATAAASIGRAGPIPTGTFAQGSVSLARMMGVRLEARY